jgi:hypothetical protein
MMSRLDSVQVHVDLEHSGQPVSMGELHCRQSRTGEIFSFTYDDSWLARPEVFAFDPDLDRDAKQHGPLVIDLHHGADNLESAELSAVGKLRPTTWPASISSSNGGRTTPVGSDAQSLPS